MNEVEGERLQSEEYNRVAIKWNLMPGSSLGAHESNTIITNMNKIR